MSRHKRTKEGTYIRSIYVEVETVLTVSGPCLVGELDEAPGLGAGVGQSVGSPHPGPRLRVHGGLPRESEMYTYNKADLGIIPSLGFRNLENKIKITKILPLF